METTPPNSQGTPASSPPPKPSPLLMAMDRGVIPTPEQWPGRALGAHVTAERAAELASDVIHRAIPRYSPPPSPLPSQSRSRRTSIDSTNSRAAGCNVPSAFGDYYARPSSRASTQSSMYGYRPQRSGRASPALSRGGDRQQRQEILTSSSDDDSPGRISMKTRSPKKKAATRNVLKSLDLRASDVGGSSSDDDGSSSQHEPEKIASSQRLRDEKLTTSSTDEADQERRRAWATVNQPRAEERLTPSRHSKSVDAHRNNRHMPGEYVGNSDGYPVRSAEHTASSRFDTSPSKSTPTLSVAPAVHSMLAEVYSNVKMSRQNTSQEVPPAKAETSKIPDAARRAEANCTLPVYQATGKYNLPRQSRSWGFEKVGVEECFDNYSWWKDKFVRPPVLRERHHGVYVQEPHLLTETQAASLSDYRKFGTHSRFNRSKYRTRGCDLGPKFDEYSPHVPKPSDLENLPLEYKKIIIKDSKPTPGFRKTYMDDLLKRGTASRDKHRALTWGTVDAFFHNGFASRANATRLDTHHYD